MTLARLRGSVALACVAALAACAQEGHVFEKVTNKPLEGVVVVKSWRGTLHGFVENAQKCYYVTYARSDKDGRFSLPRLSWRFTAAGDTRTSMVLVYKTGYHLAETNYEDRIAMEPHSDSQPTRFGEILAAAAKFPSDCPPDDVKPLVEPILRAIYAELKPLVENQSQFEKADDILGMIEYHTVGDEAATANAKRRRAEWRRSVPQ